MGIGVGGMGGVSMDALESYIALQNQVQDAMNAVSVGGQGVGPTGNSAGSVMGASGGALLEQQMRLNQLQQLQQLQNQIFQQQVRNVFNTFFLLSAPLPHNLSSFVNPSALFLTHGGNAFL